MFASSSRVLRRPERSPEPSSVLTPRRTYPRRAKTRAVTRMNILLCIDGTGDSSETVYNHDMAHSHVRKIWFHAATEESLKLYMRGSTMLGTEMVDLVSRGFGFVYQRAR